MSLYTSSPHVYCPGDGCCRKYKITAHWEYTLANDSEWECPNGHVLMLTDEYVLREWTWRLKATQEPCKSEESK